ncbi:MAG: low-specificity L-threonine aldolase [Defluviitaleaceae bacterium]|nr:low-specificity L-threonine aldolase [Defluviitaleaceae bacterium]
MRNYIDLRSDTVTQPTEEMRKIMETAIVGDDVYEDDPTVIKLQELAAEMTGFEAALFVPTGTMGNQLAIITHTKRGDEIILSENYHIAVHEVGGAAVLSGVSYRFPRDKNGVLSAEEIKRCIRPKEIHYPDTGLLCLENALSNGTVVSVEDMKSAYETAKSYEIPVHLDGARIFNAAVHLGVDVKELTQYCDSLMFCLSKGLCSPIGSMLCGSAKFIEKARKYRKLMGGGMRQVGILAACGIISLEKMTKRLDKDHENARYLAEELSKINGISTCVGDVHINIVFFKITIPDFDHELFVENLLADGIKINAAEDGQYRFVTHNDISIRNIGHVLKKVSLCLQ